MRIGFGLPARGPLATPASLVAMAQRGQQLGYDIVGFSDHVVIPYAFAPNYPYSETGRWGGGATEYLEQLTLLSFVAGQTAEIALLTSVTVLPHRNPVLTAKMLATIDVLSGGRLIVGVGTGWMREEFEALNAPPFEERGAVSDEYLRVFKELWSSERPRFDGRYVRVHDIGFGPRPLQQPAPPIWVGGESPPAIRRAARLGDAWYPINANASFPLGTRAELSAAVERLRREVEAAGRAPGSVSVVYNADWFDEQGAMQARSGDRVLLTGSVDQIVDDIDFLRGLGVEALMAPVQLDTLDATLARMEQVLAILEPHLDR